MSDEAKRVIAVVQHKNDSTLQRLAKDVPEIVKFLNSFSGGEQEQVFRSNDGLLFAFFLKVKNPRFMQAEFQKCQGTQNGDAILIFEAGELIGATGFSRAWTWLQHH